MKPYFIAVVSLFAVAASHGLLDDAELRSPLKPDGAALAAPSVPATTTTTTSTTTTTEAPTTTTTVAPVPVAAKCPDWWDEARAAGWAEDELVHVDALMWRESRCQPNARSTTRDSGLLQVNDVHLEWLAGYGITADALFDPTTNLVAARLVWAQALEWWGCGWRPWRAEEWCA